MSDASCSNPHDPTPLNFAVPSLRCGGCVATIERRLAALPGIAAVRANLTQRRVAVTPADPGTSPEAILTALDRMGHPASLIEPDALPRDGADDGTAQALLRGIAVAGFGAMNVMLLSVAVWSGAAGETRAVFHVVSALIAVPVVAYAARPFFVSALGALRARRMNMDVPIALAILLALALSLFETARGGDEVFFDAALTLTFFLLIGRYLDHRMRERARGAMAGLQRLAVRAATLVAPDGATRPIAAADIAPGMVLRILPGERVPADLRVVTGGSDVDRALVTGEARPVAVGPGSEVEAGVLNLTGPFDAVALRPVGESFLSRMVQMLAAAEAGRGRYVRVADRMARLYAPLVHLLALATFAGWVAVSGDWERAAFVAISVLIITCPCALALAVPVAHVVAAGRLMSEGVLIRDGTALERLAEADSVVWDKTGTLTSGTPSMAPLPPTPEAARGAAGALAARSAHPAARAIAASLGGDRPVPESVQEVPGYGVEGLVNGRRARLGRSAWVRAIAARPDGPHAGGRAGQAAGPAFAFEGGSVIRFPLRETLRRGAGAAIVDLERAGLPSEILSGDEAAAVHHIADRLGIEVAWSGLTPAEKVAHVQALAEQGRRPLMVGDGLNDTAALAAAHVSASPASACDAGRAAADFVFLGDDLTAVPLAVRVARRTGQIVRQNFALAALYNAIALPVAMAGLVTPLIAAIAMSASSVAVVANSLRLDRADRRRPRRVPRLSGAPA